MGPEADTLEPWLGFCSHAATMIGLYNTDGKNRGFLFQDNPWIFLFLNRFGMGLGHLIIEALETIWTNHQEEVAL